MHLRTFLPQSIQLHHRSSIIMLFTCQNKLIRQFFNGKFYSPNVKQQSKLLLSRTYSLYNTIILRKASKMASDTFASNKKNVENVKLPIYLDAQSTTKPHPDVLTAMWPYFTEKYGNCHSRTHSFGWEADKAVEIAREQIAKVIGASPKEIIFTSGATECNNMALKGVARFYGAKRNHIITVQTEHKCVLDSCRALSEQGMNVTYLPVDKEGHIDLELLKSTITPETLVVSCMTINNEIGVIHPLKEIGKICRDKNVFFHTDAAQAFGKVPINVNECNIDLMSMSGHKIYGPKGVGALYIRNRPRIRLVPLFSGGGQERGLRSGTLPVPLVVGFGEAARIAQQDMQVDYEKIKYLSDKFITGITTQLTHVIRNGDPTPEGGFPGCVNLSFACVEGESLLMALKDIALSSGSACTSASLEPSYVLRAIGADDDLAHSSIRFGISIFNTEYEIDYVVDRVVKEVNRLRQMSPLWDMVQEGIDLKTIDWGEAHHN